VTGYIAVTTTGIYCRPSCGARTPKPSNVLRFQLPAAAEAAGFRACFQCRPYRSAPLPVRGPDVVCTAVRLIQAGGLDGHTETELGARVGLSGRHLRRLFIEHLGCTPDQLARSTRAHFARRLLDDTDLSFTDLAFTCGYGSVRQMARDLRAIFRGTPTELRARRRRADRLAADGGLPLRLPFQPPLSWEPMLGQLRRAAIPGVEAVAGDSYRRTVLVEGDPAVLEFSSCGSQDLLLRAHLPHWGGLLHIAARARAMLGLDLDYPAAERHLEEDPVIGPLMRKHPGVRPVTGWDPFEAAVTGLLGSPEMAGRLARRYGRPVPGLAPLGLTHVFPTPDVVATADIGAIGCGQDLAVAVHDLARSVAAADPWPALPAADERQFPAFAAAYLMLADQPVHRRHPAAITLVG